jgi:hypothetical protein
MTTEEMNLITEALGRAASRHESEARFNPRNAAVHEKKAAKMRRLREQLLRKEVKTEGAIS